MYRCYPNNIPVVGLPRSNQRPRDLWEFMRLSCLQVRFVDNRPQVFAEVVDMPAPTPLVSVRAKRASPVTASPPAIAIPPAETAHVLSVSLSKVYDLMRKGELSSYRDGRSRRVLMELDS